jgi:hypothetical protein
MSETPKTDAAMFDCVAVDDNRRTIMPQVVYASFARQLERENAELRRDAERLNLIAAQYLHLIPFDMPTGAGDADVGWCVMQSHIGKDDVEISRTHEDDLRKAIDAALQKVTP